MKILDTLSQIISRGESVALATVVSVSGSTPRKVGTKMIVKANGDLCGQIIGTIGGGAIEHHIRKMAVQALANNKSQLISTSLSNELAMCCGGEMSVFIEVFEPPPRLLCFGAGHIMQNLCPIAINLGFKLSMFDSREELLGLSVFDQATKHELHDFSCSNLFLSKSDELVFVIIATHDHQLDQQIVEGLLKQLKIAKGAEQVVYLGLVGSKRKALMTKKRLLAKKFSENDCLRVICPAGLAINAQTPQEIALSIAAQLTRVRYEFAKNSRIDSRSRAEFSHGLSQSFAADPA